MGLEGNLQGFSLLSSCVPAADNGVLLLLHMYTAVYRYRHEFKGMKVCCIVFLSACMHLYLIQDSYDNSMHA